ncbi:hypothetical protein ACOBQX_21165 [Actinokineospora sp. G85]|uniref:hypothetical protein n=1 Tax=Actinokineospora sp. G85 TaxID=3406626 RepID=UPI003C764AA7
MTGPTDRLPVGEDVNTVEIPLPDDGASAPSTVRSGFWRELAGALALGLCVLALLVLGLQVLDTAQGVPGPGVWTVVAHVLCAVAAVLLQRQADRRAGPQAGLAILLVFVLTGVAVWFFWWA